MILVPVVRAFIYTYPINDEPLAVYKVILPVPFHQPSALANLSQLISIENWVILVILPPTAALKGIKSTHVEDVTFCFEK